MDFILSDSALQYMLEIFPRKAIPNLFNSFCEKCENGNIICEKESQKSLEILLEEETSFEWIKDHNKLFRAISQKESRILGDLVEEGIFDFVKNSNKFERNLPITIPFLTVIALNEERTIVSDKRSKDYGVLRTICQKKGLALIDIDDFLSQIKDYK